MKRSTHFTGNNYQNLMAMVVEKRSAKVKANPNKFLNSILEQHFNSAETKICSMPVGSQALVSEIDFDTIMSIKNKLKREGKGEWQSVNMGDGEFIVKRTK